MNENKVVIYDIECYGGLFLYIAYNLNTKEWHIFEISFRKNDLYALLKFLENIVKEGYWAVSFNGVSYDSQIIQYIMDNHERWIDLSPLDTLHRIKKFSDRVIDDTRYELLPPYREEAIEVKQVDLFRIHHFNNKARLTSLKWLEFMMDAEDVEETPIPFDKTEFTSEEIEQCIGYCTNDVKNTHLFYRYTIGEVEGNEFYTGFNKIQDRLDIMKEMEFPWKAMNWSDVKIGDEINKKVYLQNTGLTDKQLYDLRKNRKPTPRFTYNDCIPSYVEFKSEPFRIFHNAMKTKKINLTDKEEYPFSFNGTKYMVAKGGIHSDEKNRIVDPTDNELLIDADIGSQYANAIIKRKLYPLHLGEKWLQGYTQIRDKRLALKARIKEDKSLKGISEAFKLSLNGSYGKFNDSDNWQYDPFALYRCAIGNQFEILMLIESLEMNHIHVISANTDGIVVLFDKELKDKYYEVCAEWEKKVGNDINGKLEYTEYKRFIQSSVNDYLAIKTDGTIKRKGDFAIDSELHKNKSRRIIPIALSKYFVDGIDPEVTIKKHENIFDFLVGLKASRDYHYESIDKTAEKDTYHRLIRYYISEKGKRIMKVMNEDSQSEGNKITKCEPTDCTIVNNIDKTKKAEDYGIRHEYYIKKAQNFIYSVQSGTRKRKEQPDKRQTSLFG